MRDSTLSRFHRKIVFAARAEAHRFVAANRGLSLDDVIDRFDSRRFESRFGRVEEFEQTREYQQWTFWTYANRSAETFGDKGHRIYHQLRKHRAFISQTLEKEIAEAFARAQRIEEFD